MNSLDTLDIITSQNGKKERFEKLIHFKYTELKEGRGKDYSATEYLALMNLYSSLYGSDQEVTTRSTIKELRKTL